MECFKCKRSLTLYGSNVICFCEKCKRYFCENEGTILNNDKLIEVAKGTTDRIIYEFLCFGCEIKERTKDEMLKKQNERIAKAREEKDQTEMLKAQGFHNSDKWEVEYWELEKLPELGDVINNWERKSQEVVAPCSVYVELYGNKWPAINTKIFLIFTHYKRSDGRLVEKTEYYCYGCVKRFIGKLCKDFEHEFIIRRRSNTFKEKFPDIEFNKD